MKKKKSKVMRYVGIVIFLMYFLSVFFNLNSDPNVSFEIALLIALVFSSFLTLVIVLGIKLFLFIIIQPFIRVNQIRRIQNAKYVDSDGFDYVRDIPTNCSPALASLLLDQAIEPNKDVIATTLYLINRGYLKEEDGVISVTDKQIDKLMSHELYLIDIYSRKNGFSFSDWRERIVNDAINNDLITHKDKLNRKDIIKLAINIFVPLFIIIGLYSLINIFDSSDNIIFSILHILLILILPLFVISIILYTRLYFISFISSNIQLTENGLKEQEKMAKFKRFLKDLSNIESRRTEEIVLWEDYLTFAVALDVNKEIYWDDNFRKKVNSTSYIIQHEILNELSKIGG